MKPKTYTQLYIQLVFAVKNRQAMLNKEIRPQIFKYISGIISNFGHKSIIVNGVSNHIHILIGLNPNKTISETVHEIKRSSSIYINKNKILKYKFAWQEGYGAFSYSKSQLDNIYNYILNQESHHKKTSFRDEYIQFLKKFEIDYDDKYLFDFFE